jgi:hypothetical protein
MGRLHAALASIHSTKPPPFLRQAGDTDGAPLWHGNPNCKCSALHSWHGAYVCDRVCIAWQLLLHRQLCLCPNATATALQPTTSAASSHPSLNCGTASMQHSATCCRASGGSAARPFAAVRPHRRAARWMAAPVRASVAAAEHVRYVCEVAVVPGKPPVETLLKVCAARGGEATASLQQR